MWKSLDGGTTFAPKFDDQPVQSIGAIAVDPSNPKNVWVGTGESWTRNSVSVGNGVYRSTDGGETWTHLGLPESERIAKIIVHPKDGNTAWVCAPGKLWSDSDERGLFKTTDAGQTWTKVLAGANRSTGCSDLELDPQNPDGVLAATPSIALTTSYKNTPSAFDDPIAFYGNAKLDSVSFASDFVLTVLYADDPDLATDDNTATFDVVESSAAGDSVSVPDYAIDPDSLVIVADADPEPFADRITDTGGKSAYQRWQHRDLALSDTVCRSGRQPFAG